MAGNLSEEGREGDERVVRDGLGVQRAAAVGGAGGQQAAQERLQLRPPRARQRLRRPQRAPGERDGRHLRRGVAQVK